MFDNYSNRKENDDDNDYDWEIVYTTNREIDAEMYKANLEGAGIPVNILSQVDTTRMFTIGNLAVVKIYVPIQFFNSAKEIIDAINSESDNIQ
ncbi:MAG TPA: hypothetical protein DCW42_07615 [Bacteroidetes bacterium]|nr:hypothetical protein [Bacteroidota bacterium]